MLFVTYFLLLCTLATCRSYSSSERNRSDDFARLDSIYPEPECNAAGGTCVIAEDCTGSLIRQTGLCPRQASDGVECCHGISRKETRCQRVGGECVPLDKFCNQRLVFSRATDCPQQKCCIFV